MKIAIAHNFYRSPGGEDAVVRHESELLRRKGHDVSFFTADNAELGDDAVSKLWAALTVTYNPVSRRRFVKFLRQVCPDVVHVHNFFPQLSPSILFACKELNIPSVMTLHNYRLLCPTCFLYADGRVRERSLTHQCFWTVPRRTYRNSYFGTLAVATMVETHKRLRTWSRVVDQFIALSSFARDKFITGGLPAQRIVVKGNAGSPAGNLDLEGPRNGALYVGRLSAEKGVSVLLEAWEKMDYPLTIIGAGPLEGQIPKAKNNIKYLGYLPPEAVKKEMSRSNFLIMPSNWYEMFPMTAIEAFSCATPVISSDVPGLNEVVKDRNTGLVFQAGVVNDLIEKSLWAIRNVDTMRQLGVNGLNMYNNNFTDEINYRRLIEIYEKVIGPSDRRGSVDT